MRTLTFLLLFGLTVISAQSVNMKLKLPAIFSDNMVLQQKTDAAIWGTSEANQKVTIIGSWGKSIEVKSKADGSWRAKIKTPKAGGPYQLSVFSGKEKIEFENVLIGEVWLCSGQSNMEMPLGGWSPSDTIHTASKEIPMANYPNLRFFTVKRAISLTPENDCIGLWNECTPKTAASFSATAFFFGKKLMNELNIPIGLIHSSWGGTPVESWTSGKDLSVIPEYKDLIENYADSKEELDNLVLWLNNLPQIDFTKNSDENFWKDIELFDQECSFVVYDDSKWLDVNMPSNFDKIGLNTFDGAVWYRKQIEIPEEWTHKDLIISLGPIDDMDATYINGIKVGGFEKPGYWQVERNYLIPAELVKDKKITIAVRVIDNQGGGAFTGTVEKFRIHLKDSNESISIAGVWKYLPVAEYRSGKFYVFRTDNLEYLNRPKVSIELSAYLPSTLYNAMIFPLMPYNLRGAIWYQGESNTNQPELYKKVFPMMINNWRSEWKNQFSFYFTQIAPYRYAEGTNSQLLREAQFESMYIPKTGMAVTLDIGNIDNIHPGNKKDVGERLALWALKKDYGKKVVFSGPVYKSAKVVNTEMHLFFDHSDFMKIGMRDGKTNFQIAGEDKIFKDANVIVHKNKLAVSSPDVKNPKAVRYCWSDITEATLYGKTGLPASSFRTDDW